VVSIAEPVKALKSNTQQNAEHASETLFMPKKLTLWLLGMTKNSGAIISKVVYPMKIQEK
jgi:hypothetical protein